MLHMFLWISVELLVSRLILSLNLLYRSQKKTENAPDKFHCDQQVSVELPLFTERKNIHFCVRYEAFCIAG